jgi:hypothetical protein
VGLGKAVLPGKYPYRPALTASSAHGPVKVHTRPAKPIIHEIVVKLRRKIYSPKHFLSSSVFRKIRTGMVVSPY